MSSLPEAREVGCHVLANPKIDTKAGGASASVGKVGDFVTSIVGHKDVSRGDTGVNTSIRSGEFGLALGDGWSGVRNSV
jgi:hypothetical protein